MATSTIPFLTKYCTNPKCDHKGEKQAVEMFYVRSGIKVPTEAGHYNSHCIACMKRDSKVRKHLPADEPRVQSEKYAIEYLRTHGIHALPGKAVSAADVDVVAWGGVWIEVKYARLDWNHGARGFTFNSTVKQQQRGYLAHIVMLICEYPTGKQTFHLFDAKDPVFYKDGHVKTGLTYVPGTMVAKRQGGNRVVMVQSMMDAARDHLDLIPQMMRQIANELRASSVSPSAARTGQQEAA